jgi:hypothetical protein
MVQRVVIAVSGSEQVSDLEALSEWFAAEPELRGLVKPADAVER